jgi:integrase
MAKRFASVEDEELDNILNNRDSSNTKNVIRMATNVLREYVNENSILMEDFEQLPKQDLCEKLRTFYASLRNKKGEFYSKKSMISIRYGIQRHFLKVRKFDVVNDADFKPANLMFNAMLVKLKQLGLAVTVHKPPIAKEDLGKLYNSFDLNSPVGLQNKVFIDFMLYFCNRGRENLRTLKKEDFQFFGRNDERYVQLRDHFTKNHRGDTNDDESQGGRLYPVLGHRLCPIATLQKYLAVLNPENECFWQRPKLGVSENQTVWYDNIAVGQNTLGAKLKTLSQELELSKMYTNHCLRATTITLLDENGFEARHIMSLSGHKSESSIRSYSRTDDAKKRRMSSTLSNIITENTGN